MPTLFRRILVPYDFSMQAGEALRVAADLAAVHGGRLTVLHVVSPPRSIVEIAAFDREALRNVQKRVRSEVDRLLRRQPVKASCEALIGDPATAILTAARRVDSVVMSTLGQTGIARWLVGSVAEKVVRLSPVPVLTIRAARPKKGVRRAVRAVPR